MDKRAEIWYNNRHTSKEGKKMSTIKYDEDFKKSLVTLHQSGKTQAQLCREYGVSESALCKWVKQYATVQTDDGEVLTAK